MDVSQFGTVEPEGAAKSMLYTALLRSSTADASVGRGQA